MKPSDFYEAARGTSIDEWYQALIGSVSDRDWNGFQLPGFPPDEIQAGFVGSSNEHALTEASVFYRVMHEHMTKHGVTLGDSDNVLDFGCGWGRYMRYFYRDLPWDRLYGIDPWFDAIEICKRTGVYGQLIKCNLLPPTPLRDGMFKLIFAYSVFSHLSPKAANAWIAEFARIVAPGGLLVLTTQGRTFIDFCESLRAAPPATEWHRGLQQSFVDADKARKEYDEGQYLYQPSSGGPELPGETYGEAIIPEGYVRAHWSKYFEVLDYIDDRNYLPQAVMVLRARY
ncbi:class I SAM-dependent methyltransferase [Lysobacter sp. CA196]|uniref:class I SAM-dependent methyltransferase n=1 Tax=Lysobacter sp. CA196 TaxID=3455606 RepID=UPI003F8D392C